MMPMKVLNPRSISHFMMKKLSAYLRLFRIEHAFMLSAAVLVAELIASKGAALIALPILVASLAAPFFIEMASFALNDWFDVKTDKENRREDRPLAFGEIAPGTALAASVVFYIAGLGFAAILPASALCIAIIFAILSAAYNFRLKELPLVGNAYIAASMAIPFLFGNLVVADALQPSLLAIATVAFVAGLGREIVKSAEDVEGDVKHRKARTLPALIGKKNSAYAAAALYVVLVPLSFLPFAYGLKTNLPSVCLVAITSLAFAFMAYSVAKNQKKENLEAARKTSLLALGIGLAGYAASLI